MKTPLFHKIKYDLKGHTRSYNTTFTPKIILAHSFIYRFRWKFVWMLISWRHNFVINYVWPEMSLFCYLEVCVIFYFKTVWPDWLTSLWTTFVLGFLFTSKFGLCIFLVWSGGRLLVNAWRLIVDKHNSILQYWYYRTSIEILAAN